ncbi:MAG: hypothetical protein ACKVUS_16695 [Saprospiraceae bacterium]
MPAYRWALPPSVCHGGSVTLSASGASQYSISASGCPGPNLTFSAEVVNGGSVPNVLWYLNGAAVWSGSTYNLFGVANDSQVYCTVGPVSQACTMPNFVQSEVYKYLLQNKRGYLFSQQAGCQAFVKSATINQ